MKNKQEIVELYQNASKSLVSFLSAFVITDPVKPAKFHYWLSDLLLNSSENIAVEGFRESAKTSYVVYGLPLYYLTFPNYNRSYIVMLKDNDDSAKQKLKDIRDMYLNNKLMSANVQKVYAQGDVFDVLTKEGVRVRIEAYGKGTSIRGLTWMNRRPDIVIMDDVQTVDDVRSDTLSDRDWNWFLSDVYMLSKQSRVFMIGNNLGDRCIIERLGKVGRDFGFKFYRIPAIKDGRAVWPEKFTVDYLMKEKEAYNKAGKIDIWLRERMCQSVAEELQVFKKSYFNYYMKLPEGKYNYYTAVDLAISEKESADYTVIVTIAVSEQNIRFIERLDYFRTSDLDVTMSKIFEHVRQFRPQRVAVEKVAFQAAMEKMLKKKMLDENMFFTLEMVQPKGSKEMRIYSGLQPLYAAGAIFHKQGADYLSELENELLMFTKEGAKSEHDDLMDALQMANAIANVPVGGVRKTHSNIQRKAVM